MSAKRAKRAQKGHPAFFLFAAQSQIFFFFFLYFFFISEGRMFFFPTRRSLFALTLFFEPWLAQWRKAFRDAVGSV
jgi:hypothetical protein